MFMNLKAELGFEEIEKILKAYVERQVPGEYTVTDIKFQIQEKGRDMRGESMGSPVLDKAVISLSTKDSPKVRDAYLQKY